jgi:Acyl-coenzyme A synthetases/AMP-(fatty) acid ligases
VGPEVLRIRPLRPGRRTAHLTTLDSMDSRVGTAPARSRPGLLVDRVADPADRIPADRIPAVPGGASVVHELVDRHATGTLARVPALRRLDRHDIAHDLTYAQLADETARFAGVLHRLGVLPGERLGTLLPPVPQLPVAVLGAFTSRVVVAPLSPALGPQPVRERLALSSAAVLITTPQLYACTVAPIRDRLPDLRAVLVVTATGAVPPDTLDLAALMDVASPTFDAPRADPDDPALLHVSDGPAGPTGILQAHEVVTAHLATARAALDLGPGDVVWCTVDPGTPSGTVHGLLAPLAAGATVLTARTDLDIRRCYRVLVDHRVTVWCTTPGTIRRLLRSRTTGPALPALRMVASVGEPLGADAARRASAVLGVPVVDTAALDTAALDTAALDTAG